MNKKMDVLFFDQVIQQILEIFSKTGEFNKLHTKINRRKEILNE